MICTYIRRVQTALVLQIAGAIGQVNALCLVQMLGGCGCSAVHIICDLSATGESESEESPTLDNLGIGVIRIWNILAAHDFGPTFVSSGLQNCRCPQSPSGSASDT